MLRGCLTAFTIVAFFSISTLSHAATLTETTDFPDGSPGTNLGELSGETVTVTGSISTTCVQTIFRFADCLGGDEQDLFSFTLADGAAVTNYTFTISNFTRSSTQLIAAIIGNRRVYSLNGAFTVSNDLALSASSGLIRFAARATSSTTSSGVQGVGSISYDYMITFDVSEGTKPPDGVVPLPASGLLMLGGLIGLAALRRRGRAS